MEQNRNVQSPVISVIVPIYKVESYLPQCIDSVLAQTFSEFELILVDDGSPDNCGTICDDYATRDSRITVIHQKNAGVSAARNAGIDWVFANSSSRWIFFLDSDDALASIALETLFREASRHRADIATTHLFYFSDDAELIRADNYVGETSCIAGRQILEDLYTGKESTSVVTCAKLIRRELLQNVRFPVGKIHEDQATTPILLFHTEHVAIVRSWLYYYRVREGSITHSAFSVNRFDDVDAVNSCTAHFEAHGDHQLAKQANKFCNVLWAWLTVSAIQAGIYRQVPAHRRMNPVRALWLLFLNNLHRGGLQLVINKIKSLPNRLKK